MRPITRALLTVVLLLLVVAGLAYWRGTIREAFNVDRAQPTGTSGVLDASHKTGAEVGEKIGRAADAFKESVDEAALTSKIKAKMVLDDYVKARTIDVSTQGSTVTLSGLVRSVAEHDRAVRLARETAGVDQVIDHIAVQP